MEIKKYYGKIILFGEYSMILGSSALLMPLYSNSSHWDYVWRNPIKRNYASHHSLISFYKYLSSDDYFREYINLSKLKTELNRGLFLDSDIPSGYGVGSSGALTAAVYDRFRCCDIEDPMMLKELFARMENRFHGNSSGFDPLQCFYGKPFILNEEKEISFLNDDFLPEDMHVFLLDSNMKSDTKSLVNYFNEKLGEPRYAKAYEELYLPYVNRCIDSIVSGDVNMFFDVLSHLSYYQTILFEPMVTENMAPLFLLKRDTAHFQLKICGSGGGGYFLGFSDDKDTTEKYMEENNLQISWIL